MLDTLIKMRSGKYQVTVIHMLNCLQGIFGDEVLTVQIDLHVLNGNGGGKPSIYNILKFHEGGSVSFRNSHGNWTWNLTAINEGRRTVKTITMIMADKRPRICIVVN